MKVLVTGAAGYIGGRMADDLREKEWVEKVIGIDINESGGAHSKYRFFKRDIRRSLDDIIVDEAVDTVVHTAWVLPPKHDKGLMEDINKGGTRNILTSAVKHNIKQILYTSSTMAYGFHPDNDRPLTEESALRGNDDFTYAKNKKEMEELIGNFSREHPNITVSIVRPCFVVGPGFKNPLAEYLKKKFVPLAKNTLPWQFVHEDDLINVMLLLLEKRVGGIYNVAGDGTMTFTEMVKGLGNIPIRLPWPVLYFMNNLAWSLRLSFITEFPSPAMRAMVNPWLASSKKLIDETGYRFQYDTKSAFQDFADSALMAGYRL